MKKIILIVLSLFLFQCGGGNTPSADADSWTKASWNPIVGVGASGRFDDGYVTSPLIVKDNGTYYLYYTGGHDADQTCREKGGLATSTDLRSWVKIDGAGPESSLMGCGVDGSFDYDRAWFSGGTVMKDGNIWKVWYPGDSDITANHVARVGYATSTDGVVWTKQPGAGTGGCIFEDMDGVGTGPRGVITLSIIKESTNDYRMIYGIYPTTKIKYAKSTDGITWEIQNSGNAVLNTMVAGGTSLIKIDGIYYFYVWSPSATIMVYTSTDLINWTTGPNQLSQSAGQWDSSKLYYATPFVDTNGQSLLFYAGTTVADLDQQIGIAYLPENNNAYNILRPAYGSNIDPMYTQGYFVGRSYRMMMRVGN